MCVPFKMGGKTHTTVTLEYPTVFSVIYMYAKTALDKEELISYV